MANFDAYPRDNVTDPGSASGPSGASPAAGLQPVTAKCIYIPMATSGATGTADDITVNSADLPTKFRVLRFDLLTSTAGAGSTTVTLRTAAAAGGSALSTAVATSATGRAVDANTVSTTSAAATGLFLRRTDRSHVGEAHLWVIPTI